MKTVVIIKPNIKHKEQGVIENQKNKRVLSLKLFSSARCIEENTFDKHDGFSNTPKG